MILTWTLSAIKCKLMHQLHRTFLHGRRAMMTATATVVPKLETSSEKRNRCGGLATHVTTVPEFRRLWEHDSRLDTLGSVLERKDDNIFRVCGRVYSKREAGRRLVFYDIEGMEQSLQLKFHLSREKESKDGDAIRVFEESTSAIARGDVVEAIGIPHRTKRGELTLLVDSITCTAKCRQHLPLELKDPELRYQYRHIDLLVNGRRAVLLRHALLQYVRQFFVERSFIEVETPVLWSQTGGAAARPFTTKRADQSSGLSDGETLQMRIAPELFLKQLVVGGVDRVFELGKVFRNEGCDRNHLPEFTTLEAYQAHADYLDAALLIEDLLRGLFKNLQELNLIGDESSDCIAWDQPFQRLNIVPVLESEVSSKLMRSVDLMEIVRHQQLDDESARKRLLDLCSNLGCQVVEPITTARIFDRLIGQFVEPLCVEPTFLMDHPLFMCPLAQAHIGADSPKGKNGPLLAQRFELFVRGQELVNAYSELADPQEQRRRFSDQMKDRLELHDEEVPIPNETFCEVLEFGLPPTAGIGIGIDRLGMLMGSINHIRDMVMFPMTRSRLNSIFTKEQKTY